MSEEAHFGRFDNAATETVDEIAAEMERYKDRIIRGRRYPERLRAAFRREKAAIEADALAVGGIVEAERKRKRDNSGDCAKLREALKDIRRIVEQILLLYSDFPNEIHVIARKANAALAAPARNCDKYENDNAIEQFEREILGKESATTYERLENMRENWFRYNSWLFEKAKERRGDESPRTGQEGK